MLHRAKAKAAKKDPEKLSRYQRLGLFFFTKPRMTLLLWMLIASFGAVCYTTLMQREGFPNVAGPYSTVSGTYFVNDRTKVDREAARPIAEAVTKLPSVKAVNSQAGDNFFALQIEFKEDTKATDGSRQVEETIKAQNLLPKGSQAEFKPYFVSKLTPEGDDLLISVASRELATGDLQAKAEAVAQALAPGGSAAIDGAAKVHAVNIFRQGVNPATGTTQTEQKSFDWIATKENGQVQFSPSVLVAVQAKEGVGILSLDDATKESLAKLSTDPNFGQVNLEIAADFAESIRTQTHSLQENLLGGLIAVVLVSFLFISLRASLIIAVAMATVLAITVGILYVAGLTLNTITLFSLILCLGLIVDDTIIMAEAIDKRRRKKGTPYEVVAEALKKVALASSAGTLTTMLAFAPLLFISGIMGQFINAIPITIIVSLAVSLVVSIVLIPFLARYTLLRGEPKQLSNPISKVESLIAGKLSQLVRRVGRSRKQGVAIGLGAILISFIMLAGGVYFAGKLKFNIFPPTKDSDALIMSISFAPGSSIADAQQVSERANKVAAETIGQYVTRVSYQGSGTETNSRATIDLVSYKDRDITAPELATQLNEKFKDFSGASVQVSADAGPAPTGAFTMQIRTEDSAKAEKLGLAIKGFLDDRELKRPNGTVAHIQDVEVSSSRTVQRLDAQRYIEVNGKFDADDTSTLVSLAQQAVKDEFTSERVERQFGLEASVMKFDVGQESENQESFQSMLIAFPVLLVVMYLLLALQFRSTSQPLMIFLAIPFSFFGVAAGLYFTDNSFSFFTMLAIFALIGIAVNNTILLTDYANKGRERGLRRSEAMAVALEERFRPLLTTSLTGVVALIPLALSDPFWEALAVTLIFGLLSSAFLVVVAFPYYYLGNELLRSRFNRWRALGWLALLVGGAIGASKLGGSNAAMGFLVGYVLVTIIVSVVRRRRKK